MYRYSQDLCQILQQLIFDEQNFDWTQFNANLSYLPQLQNQRIQDLYKGISLESIPKIQDLTQNVSLVPQQQVQVASNTNLPLVSAAAQVGGNMNQSLNQSYFYGNPVVGNAQDKSPIENVGTNYANFGAYGQQAGIFGNANGSGYAQQQQQQDQQNIQGNNMVFNNNFNASQVNPYNPIIPQMSTSRVNLPTNLQTANHSPNVTSFTGQTMFPQYGLANTLTVHGNNQIQANPAGINQQALQQYLLQLLSQQLENQQQSQNLTMSRTTYSPMRGGNVFQQFNARTYPQQNETAVLFSALSGIPRRVTRCQYEDGSIYEGEMVLEYRDGFGKLVFSNKGIYEGSWKLNRMHGKGTLYLPNGDIAYEGDWFEDLFNNFGHLYNSKAQYTKLPFDYKDFSLIQNYWLRYEGEFALDQKHGFGTLFLTNGERYSGNFKNDQVHGYGVFNTVDGDMISGQWENNYFIKRM